MSVKARVSLCMIVRDEAHNLGDCLSPVADLFDEIVIVDTGSQDNTKQIARQFTPHVHDFPWCDDFSAARNESLRHATSDWIFWLDADDRVPADQIPRLRALFGALDDRPRLVLMETVLQPVDPNDDVWYVTHPRLFRRHAELRWHERVHEQLRPEPASLGYEVNLTDLQINHIGYQDNALFQRKLRRKLRLLRMDYAINPDNASTLFHLAMTLLRSGQTREARKHLWRLLDPQGNPNCLRRVYTALAELSLFEGNPDESVHVAAAGLAQFPNDEHLLYALACAYYALEDYAAAAETLERIISGAAVPAQVNFGVIGNVRSKLAPRMLGVVRRMQGMRPEAETLLKGVLGDFPADLLAWYNLGLLYLDQREGNKLSGVVRQLVSHSVGESNAGMLTSLWHLRNGDPSLAGPIIDELIAKDPQAARPRMLRAEWLSRCRFPLADQIHALRDVLRVQPGNQEARRMLQTAEQIQSRPAARATNAQSWSTTVMTMPGVPAA